jgi:hypothetical protein
MSLPRCFEFKVARYDGCVCSALVMSTSVQATGGPCLGTLGLQATVLSDSGPRAYPNVSGSGGSLSPPLRCGKPGATVGCGSALNGRVALRFIERLMPGAKSLHLHTVALQGFDVWPPVDRPSRPRR